MRETILVAVLLAFGCPVWAASERLVVFVSDLHLGIGHAKSGDFDPFEDARWSSDWKGFLDAIDHRGKSNTDLVLNGDTFELWQALAVPCGDGAARHGCNAAQASERLARIVAEHTREELEALATFVKSGGNRVILVPGNHDVALMYPDVAAEAVKAMGGGRVIVRTNGYWLSDDQLVYAEHGHQIKPEANSFPHWPLPFADADPTGYLESPWGEQFVVDFYNPYERIYPVIDNISNEFEAFSIARRAEGAAHTALGVGRLVAFLFGKVTPRQFVQGLGPGDPQDTLPVWNLDKIAKDVESRERCESVRRGLVSDGRPALHGCERSRRTGRDVGCTRGTYP